VNEPGKSQAVKIQGGGTGTPFQRERDSDRGVGKLTDLDNLRSRGRQETCFAVGEIFSAFHHHAHYPAVRIRRRDATKG
jgi:hypothetical protein